MKCKNCGLSLNEQYIFCSSCGAKVIKNRLTFQHLWSEFAEKVFNLDNSLFRTFLMLFKAPESVINGYIEGQRKRYIHVFSYFAIALTLAGFQLFILRKYFPDAFDITVFMGGPEIPEAPNVDWVYDYYSMLSLLNLPFYALLAKLTFSGLKKYNYLEHLVINTYIIAQYTITTFLIIIIMVVLGVNYFLAGNITTLLLIAYAAYCYKRIYPLNNKQVVLRALLFFGILIALGVLLAIIQAVLILTFGSQV